MYQYGSNDPTGSFQAATRIAPETAESLVRSYEHEHISHEQVKAKEKGSEVVSQNVSIQYKICAECSRSYVAGGTTKTVTRSAVGSGMGKSASGADGGKSVDVWA